MVMIHCWTRVQINGQSRVQNGLGSQYASILFRSSNYSPFERRMFLITKRRLSLGGNILLLTFVKAHFISVWPKFYFLSIG